MFNFKTDFFSPPKVGQIIENNVEIDNEKIETSSQPDPVEQQTSDYEDAFEESNFETISMEEAAAGDTDDAVETGYREIEAFPAELPEDGPEQEEAVISETRVFYHPEKLCVDTAGANILDCTNTPVPIMAVTDGVTAKVPVVLAELNVQINVDSMIRLPEPALEIKDIKKNVKLTQCLVLQDPDQVIPPMLFLKGFVRKNINYGVRDCSNQEGVCGDIRHCTVDVPFNCATSVVFNGADPILPVVNTQTKFQFFRREDLPDRKFPEKDQLLSGDFSEFNQITEEFFNELPYCELVSARIVEYDEFINRVRPPGEHPFEEREFSRIEEKMILLITIKVLQKQQVAIPAVTLTVPTNSLMPRSVKQVEFTVAASSLDGTDDLAQEDQFIEVLEDIDSPEETI